MSKHHHHPHEGHGDGGPSNQHLRHNWFFYVAGFFLLLALLGFILSGNLALNPATTPAPAPAPSGSGK
jgi:hypothetical protein